MKDKDLSEQQEIVENFQRLRDQQQGICEKIAEVDDDRKEYRQVLEALNEMRGDRKCYRMIGNTLVQYKVEEVVPILKEDITSFDKLFATLQEQLVAKGRELNEYREKNNIRFVTEREILELTKASSNANQNVK